ncbi:MAG: Fur family transcriptional regulator [Actinomycetota bacterium]|nr:Fur family transcriptional regulator [Actinomycetota bacterium]
MDEHGTSVEDALHGAIREAGLRLTLPRRAICRFLAKNGERFLTVSEIIDGVEKSAGRIDSSTVYRTLDEFARIGLVHHVHFGNQPGRWHLTIDHDHQHLVCEVCEKTTLVPLAEVAPMFDHFRDAYGFHTNLHHFAILGHCKDCQPHSGNSHA